MPFRIEQLIHRVQPLERVLAVEDARLVCALLVEIEDPPPESAVDRSTADDQRIAEPALIELLHAGGHLLARAHQERRQADGVGVDLERLVDDGVERHLLAEVEHRVAVVAEDGVHQVLANVVHISVHGRKHHLALRVSLTLLEVLLEMRDRALHHLGALQHERAG